MLSQGVSAQPARPGDEAAIAAAKRPGFLAIPLGVKGDLLFGEAVIGWKIIRRRE
jgi:hypothetical protein